MADPGLLFIAAAKIRAGQSAGKAAELAHQLHGAIGFTDEHELHLYTRRLWSWRDEYGSESYWSTRLGEILVRGGADAFWDALT
jgi:alkylation response protein AidB-like acyl-CoA dehydrogenase